MVRYIAYRLLVLIPVLFIISVFVFIIIQLPPGDFHTDCRQDPTRECPEF